MSVNNPSITASDIITDVESRLGSPNVSSNYYLPWVSYSYQKTYQALVKTGQAVKERLFGAYTSYTLDNGTAEYSLATLIPRWGGFIKVEMLYGGTEDTRVRVNPLTSIAHWNNQSNVTTSYRAKTDPVYYILGDTIGFIPTPPATDASSATAYFWYVRRPYQIDDVTDVIDIPYRFIYPVVNYVQAKALQRVNEAYQTSAQIEAKFEDELMSISDAADSEVNENDGYGFEVSTNSPIFDNPLS